MGQARNCCCSGLRLVGLIGHHTKVDAGIGQQVIDDRCCEDGPFGVAGAPRTTKFVVRFPFYSLGWWCQGEVVCGPARFQAGAVELWIGLCYL